MTEFFDWIDRNPSAFASLASAIIAASVALMVFALTQFIAVKRQRTQFLTPKLEELYLRLNKVAEDNASFFKLVYLCIAGDEQARHNLEKINELELYGHRLAKEIIMYIRLYFPKLSKIHQCLFSAQRNLNQLIFHLHSETPPELERVVKASGRIGHFLRLMEAEIIRNRDHLLKDYLLFRRYKPTTAKEIESEIPPPDVPITNLPNGKTQGISKL